MTVLRYETLARRFLTARVTQIDELGVADLDGADRGRWLDRLYPSTRLP